MSGEAILRARPEDGPRAGTATKFPSGSVLGDECGTVAIEFALVLVVFLSILFGIMAFGFQFAARIALSYAVAEGGRSAVAGLTSQERQQLASDAVNRVLTSFSPMLDPTLATVTVSSEGMTPDGEVIEIAVTYNDSRFNIFPFLPALNANRAVQTTFLVADPSS
jgi:Flp pilus assembly protein TadG